MTDERRVKSVASDVPDRYPEVDEQLIDEYGEEIAELIRQQRAGGR